MSEKLIRAQVKKVSPIADNIMQLILAPEEYLDYKAGHYLQIVLGDEALSYSIANAPLGTHEYELHIRHTRDNPITQQLFNHIKQYGSVLIRLPFGECTIERLEPKLPIIFIAAGTGFAPVNSMIEQLLAQDDPRTFELFWGARTLSDLYLDDKVKGWAKRVPRFRYHSLLSEEKRKSLAALVLEHHVEDFKEWQMVISGPFDMVYSTRDQLVAQGILAERLFSDAFSFEAKSN